MNRTSLSILIFCLAFLAACSSGANDSQPGRSNSGLDLSNPSTEDQVTEEPTRPQASATTEPSPTPEDRLITESQSSSPEETPETTPFIVQETTTATNELIPTDVMTATQALVNSSESTDIPTTPPDLPALPLTLGSNQKGVEKLQERLLELGYPLCGDTSTYFGPQTKAMARLFQKKNNLEADGIVGKKTWEALFSDSAKLYQLEAPQRELRQVMKIDRIYGMDADDKFLWGVRWFFNAPSELVKIDTAKAIIVKENQLSEIGKVKDPNGKNIPQSIKPYYVTAFDNLVWIGGLTSAGAYQGEAVVQALLPSGKPASDPIFFRYVPDPTFFNLVALVNDGKTAWAAANTPFTMLYELRAKSSETGTRISLFDVSEANDVAMGKEVLFVAGKFSNEEGIWQVNPKNGRVIDAYSVCGNYLAYDDNRLWVASDENRPYKLYAIDPKNGDILAVYPLDSSVAAMTAENGSLWIVLVKDSHYTLWTVK